MLPNTDHSETPPTQNSTVELENPDSLEDESAKKTAGRWTKEEHQRFVDGLKKFGKNWKRIEEHVGTRSGAQIRSHAQKFFIRLEKEFDLESKNSKGVSSGKDIPASLRKASDCSNSTTCSYQGRRKMSEQLPLGQDINPESSKVLESLISSKINNLMNTIPKNSEAEAPICFSPVVNNISFSTNNLALNQIYALNSIQNFQQKQRRMSIDALPPTFPTTPLFDAFTSNLRPSDNALGLSRLTELMGLAPQIGLNSNLQPYFPAMGLNNLLSLNNIGTHNFDQLATLPPVRNPRKFSEDNVLIQNRQDTLQRFAPNNWTEFDLLTKRLKKL